MKKQNSVLETLKKMNTPQNEEENKMKLADIITLLDNAPSHEDKYYIEVMYHETLETVLCERVSTVLFFYDEWLEDNLPILNSEVIGMSPNVIDENGVAHDGLTFYVI